MNSSTGLLLLLLALGGFAAIGLGARSSRDVHDHVVARSSQRAGALGLSFAASGLGAWVLLAAPEVGALVGVDAVVGYALAVAAPLLVLAALGPRLRALLPGGHSLGDVAHARFGRSLQLAVGGVSLLYMLAFLAAELTAVAAVVGLLAGSDPRLVVTATAVGTLAYTTVGGLRASIRTDRWQAWLLLVLLGIVGAVVAGGVDLASALDGASTAGLLGVDRVGLSAAATLVVAVTCANLFHQGYWQRVWSAADGRALRRGAVLGAVLSVPAVALAGLAGVVAAGAGIDLGDPAVPFFALLGVAPGWVAAPALVLGVALVASSVDTLESGLAALVTPASRSSSTGRTRLATALLVLPAVAVALQGLSVLRLLLVADLLAAAVVVPALAVLWRRATSAGAVAGSAAGLVGAVLPAAWVDGGLAAVTFAGGTPFLAPFASALCASAITTVAVSMVTSDHDAVVAAKL